MEPITNADQLPDPGTRESNSLDFKKNYRKDGSFQHFEFGKDVAAMANAMGGTILVGAQEAASALKIYIPLSTEEADSTIRSIEEAVRDRCSPSPVVATTRIPYQTGHIVAVVGQLNWRNSLARSSLEAMVP
jgi:predicted HTH transcriptional regulator